MQYRQHAARSIGEFFNGTSGATSTTAVLIDPTAPLKSSVRSAQFYKDWWLFRPNGQTSDQLRVVAVDDPTTGTLTPDLAWSIAPSNGEKYELHGIVEPQTQMTELINQTLKRCLGPVEMSYNPTSATATRYNFGGTFPQVTQPQWIRDVGFLSTGETRDQINPYARRLRGWASYDYGTSPTGVAAATLYLNHPGIALPTTATVYVLTLVRAYNWCAPTAGVQGTQNGLISDGDTSFPVVEWVTAGVMSEAWARFGHVMDATSNQRLIRDQASAAQWFEAQTQRNFILPALYFRRMDWFGPLPVGPGVLTSV